MMYFDKTKAYKIADDFIWQTRIDYVCSGKRCNSPYLQYCSRCNLHERINNRSWLGPSFDGAMILSYKYKRRNLPKTMPYIFRQKHGMSCYFDIPY